MSLQEKTIPLKELTSLLLLSNSINFSSAITQRKNTYGGAASRKNSGVVGVSKRHHSTNCTISVFTRKLIKSNPGGPLLIQLMNRMVRSMFPEFHFTAVMMNKNFEGGLHVDRLNINSSVMITFGDFAGGELMIYNHATDRPHLLQVKNKAIMFDGNLAHATMPYRGTRYTYVFFDTTDYYRAQMSHPTQDSLLLRLGFCPQSRDEALARIAETRGKYPSKQKRVDGARPHEERLRRQMQSRLLRRFHRHECRQLASPEAQPPKGGLGIHDSPEVGSDSGCVGPA